MRRALQLALGVGMLIALAAGAAAPPPKPPREADQFDYAFLASDRPVLLRLHLRMGEKVYDADWHVFMEKVFAWFDRNNDGWLDAKEAARIPQAFSLINQVNNGVGGQTHTPVPMATLDTNKDGKVSKAEFKAYYRNGGLNPLRFSFNNNMALEAKRVNESMYKRLDRDGDGKLTAEESAKLPELLRQLDEDEDELLTAREINTEGGDPRNYGRFRGRMNNMAALPAEPGLLELRPGSTGAEHVGQLLARYDKNKDGKLARNEIALDAKLFDALDKNRDGFLDAKELPGLFQGPPDLAFRVRAGPMPMGTTAVPNLLSKLKLMKPDQKSVPPERVQALPSAKRDANATPFKRIDGENVSFELGDSRVQLQGAQGQNFRGNGLLGFYTQQFDVLEEKKGYVAKSQEKAAQGQQTQFLFFIFTQADKDGDDKLTKKELEAWLNLTGEGMNCHVAMDVNDQGRGLFDVLDANGDGRLSIRETRAAWERARPLCKAGQAGLTLADLPRTLRISIAQGQGGQQFTGVVFGAPMMTPMRSTTGGPPWFQKMDRNGDGDVSPREWFGTEEDFRAIDLDGDGLISLEEAKKYEARRADGKK